jgi:hypothetical protein
MAFLHMIPGISNSAKKFDLPIVCIQDPDVKNAEQRARIWKVTMLD